MNILPFVLSFLLLLAIGATTILHQTTGIIKEQRAISGYLAADREVRSEQNWQAYKAKKLTEFYSKMVKGTNIYDTKTGRGYPPLEDFFTIGSEKSKICFPYASREVLSSILGEGLTQKVIDAEEKQWRSGKKETLGL